jgi:hypothetical protein
MKPGFLTSAVFGMILLPCTLIAQAPAGAPAGTTGKCKDGTVTSATKKQGSCKGHKGVDTRYASEAAPANGAAAAAAAPSASSKPAPSTTANPSTAAGTTGSSSHASASSAPAKTSAAGGGPGMVWVNTATNVYHCYGTQYYGTTKAGKYMSEADAKAAGAHPEHGKACSK